MKKRVLSMLLAFILCFSTLPMTAFAQEADAVAEQEEQQETDSAAEQEEAEAAAAPGEETPADKSTTAATPGTEDSTAGEAPDTVEPVSYTHLDVYKRQVLSYVVESTLIFPKRHLPTWEV